MVVAGVNESEIVPPHLEKLHQELQAKVEEYFRAWWAEMPEGDDPEDYISSWIIVVNYGNLRHKSPSGYTVEAFPSEMPPHAMKGLLNEGVDWVVDRQENADDEEDSDG